MTNLRCTADLHAVPPLNTRHVESGIIPDHFSTGWKTYPAHHNLSERAPTNPRCIIDQHTLSPIKARSLPIRPFFQSGRERGLIGSLVWTGLYLVCTRFYLIYWICSIEFKSSYKFLGYVSFDCRNLKSGNLTRLGETFCNIASQNRSGSCGLVE